MEEKLNAVLEYLETLKQGQDRLEQGQDRLEQKLDNFSSETTSRFNHVEEQLNEHKEIFKVVSDQMMGIKIDIDYLSEKTGKHDTKLNSIDKRFQS